MSSRKGHPDPNISVYRPGRAGIRKVLGDLEADIMEVIWARPSGEGTTVRDVVEALYARRRLAYTTVMSTMARLARKNLLTIRERGQAYVYYPAFSSEQFTSRVVHRILEDLLVGFAGSGGPHAVRRSASEEARIRRFLNEIRSRRAEGGE